MDQVLARARRSKTAQRKSSPLHGIPNRRHIAASSAARGWPVCDAGMLSQNLVARYGESTERKQLEAFIRSEFLEHFEARLATFMPMLIGLYDRFGGIAAAVGCRSASQEPLFLETYMDAPVEAVMAKQLGAAVSRDQIVEVGNLACTNARSAMAIVQGLIPFLLDAGFTWVVFTGADTVVTVFKRLRLYPEPLCAADKMMLGDEQENWGTYYDHNPVVMAGRLLDGIDALDSVPGVQ